MPILLRLLAVALLAPGAVAGWAWWRSEAHLASFNRPEPFAAPIPTDAAGIAKGEHIARTRGCISCHGEGLRGEVFHDGGWWMGRAVAPSVARLAKDVGAAALEAAIRRGIGHDGRALYSMPSYNFTNLSDADTAALIGFIRQLPPVEAPLPAGRLGPGIRWEIATGADHAIPVFVDRMPGLAWQQDPRPSVRRGEYLAMTSCNECHGFTLRGDDPWSEPGKGPPDLAIVGAYSKPDFVRLMRTGKAAGNRELGLMSEVARSRFIHWTDEEVNDLYDFLGAVAEGRSGAASAAPGG